MRTLTCSIAIAVTCALSQPDARQAADTPQNHIALAKSHYNARRLADAVSEVARSVALMRQERADHATDAPVTGPDGNSYKVGGSVPQPILTKGSTAKFTDDAIRRGAAGIVTLEFVVKPDGKVDQVRVLKSVPSLDEAAKAALKQSRYEPTLVNGRPAPVLAVAAMSFTWRRDPMPATYLDMAAFYYKHRHYGSAEGLLNLAQNAIRDEAKAFGTTPADGPPRWGPGTVTEPRKLKGVPPVYPPVAESARIQGAVVVDAIIDVEGNVKGARVVRSVPPLDQAAVDAVRQWKYTPARLNGAPMECIMSVTVTFKLR
jgi:TonB family protein